MTEVGRQVLRRGFCIVAATVLAVGVVAGCVGPDEDPRPSVPSGESFDDQIANARQVDRANAGNDAIKADLVVGSCVGIDRMFRGIDYEKGESVVEEVVSLQPCDRSGMVVVQRAATIDDCVSDADIKYPVTGSEGEPGVVLCLDYNWVEGRCLSVLHTKAIVVDCDGSSVAVFRPEQVLVGDYEFGDCPESRFVHPDRAYTVCATEVE
ncbi:hypothetical protein GIY30_11475 [Gordonia sp. HNM0687]|uniref:LppU protein n=1 Tax=Gordonia mangrovi TaxID=2665643 RepID=A0A6L7GTY6_9ACTN|nr:hypothetical protein [Gordonia mangrovi]MXP21968.1 hypothetical protein [Gordonia mangrovi]UVF76327.1 hypothetical protein NWF22_13095 [Gordonia mangrovi]